MVDKEGFRSNIAIVICDGKGKLFWAKRVGQNSWQFPQGGIDNDETPEQAMYRELYEEVGLERDDVEIIAVSKGWLRYRIPKNLQRKRSTPVCIGQKQRWYLLKLVADESKIRFDATGSPEFDGWQWVNYWYPVRSIVNFKRGAYRRGLQELAPYHIQIERQLSQDISERDSAHA